jgi:hypothetical protein
MQGQRYYIIIMSSHLEGKPIHVMYKFSFNLLKKLAQAGSLNLSEEKFR